MIEIIVSGISHLQFTIVGFLDGSIFLNCDLWCRSP